MSDIPSRFDEEFLGWFRHKTETAWADHEPRDFMSGPVGGHDWQRGTRWVGGLSNREIDAVEERWSIRFPPDYRLFLSTLHATDRQMVGAKYEGATKVPSTKPAFRNWLIDTAALKSAFDWPHEGFCFDLEHNDLWQDSWGPKPVELTAQRQRLKEVLADAPPLIPLQGHRYLLSTPMRAGNSVLSVYQSDIIFYGTDLRRWMLLEFSYLLGLDDDYDDAYSQANVDNPHDPKQIPFWGEFLS